MPQLFCHLLGERLEPADSLDLVPVKINPNRKISTIREDIKDLSSDGELTGHGGVGVAEVVALCKTLGHLHGVKFLSDLERHA